MIHFDKDTTIQDVLDNKELKEYSEYFYYKFPPELIAKRIDETSWYAREAINWFYDKMLEGKTSIHYFNIHRKNVNLIQISHQNRAKFVFIVSGGGLINIAIAHEGIAMGKELYDQGFDIFLLTYRLKEEAKLNNTTIDINEAMSFINKNKEELNIDINDFILMGCSAGASVAASYCSNNRGYIKHNNPKPKCLCLQYPIVDIRVPERFVKKIVIGNNPSRYLENKYSVTNHAKGTFPATFIVHSKDDTAVSCTQSMELNKVLEKNNIPSQLILFETGQHGWSVGKGLEPEGWLNSLIKFYKNL